MPIGSECAASIRNDPLTWRAKAMRYWLYKNNDSGGPAGYRGDWDSMVFAKAIEHQWGGHYATRSAQVGARLDSDVASGDLVVAYQTDLRAVIGFCVITRMTGSAGDRKIYLQPIERLAQPFPFHERKVGTTLENSWAVRGPVMLAELTRAEMEDLIRIAAAPQRVLKGKPRNGGYRP